MKEWYDWTLDNTESQHAPRAGRGSSGHPLYGHTACSRKRCALRQPTETFVVRRNRESNAVAGERGTKARWQAVAVWLHIVVIEIWKTGVLANGSTGCVTCVREPGSWCGSSASQVETQAM